MSQARAGEPAAWDALFRRYQLPLYVYVFELVRDEQAALDLVQETFIAAVRHLGSLREDAKFGSWLFGIAHQKCIQRWRKRTEVLLDEIPETPDEFDDGPDDLLIRREQEAAFMNLLDQLPPPQRSVLLLHFVEDFSLEEIARITETQLGTVKSRLHYAKKSLRKLSGGEEMKTPREILFARHQAAKPKLDAIRPAVVAELQQPRHQAAKPDRLAGVSWWLRCSIPLWRELILPSRRIWTGLAAVWLLLFVINVSQRDPVSGVTGQPVRAPAVMMSWQVQQRWMDELLADRSTPPEAERPRTAPPRPRTEENEMMAA